MAVLKCMCALIYSSARMRYYARAVGWFQTNAFRSEFRTCLLQRGLLIYNDYFL